MSDEQARKLLHQMARLLRIAADRLYDSHDADDPQLEDEMACALATYAQVRAGGDLSDMITAVTTRDITPPTDPASHAFQRDQAYNTIRELLKLYDDVKLDIADALTYMDAGHHDEASEVLTKWAP